jgi:hypothetical protein
MPRVLHAEKLVMPGLKREARLRAFACHDDGEVNQTDLRAGFFAP